ncbi:MAG: BMC domain-containing protein [Spirochaetota bacterium]
MELMVLGALELSSIAVGYHALDEMLKAAPVTVIDARTICPGKFLILITGDVASVDASLAAGKNTGEGYLIDQLFLPRLHRYVIPAITGSIECKKWDAVGILECFSTTASIEAGDRAAKAADVVITEIRLSTGMGGKSYVKMLGDIYQVQAAMRAGVDYVKGKGLLCKDIILPSPHVDIRSFFL